MYTRCPACDTVFQIDEAQLQVREGVVRCGRCRHVFNARWNLVDLPGEEAGGAAPPPPPEIVQANEPGPAEAAPPEPAAPGDWHWALPARHEDEAGGQEVEAGEAAPPEPPRAEEGADTGEQGGEPPAPAALQPVEALLEQEPDEEIVLDASAVPPATEEEAPAPASLDLEPPPPPPPARRAPPPADLAPRRRRRRRRWPWALGSLVLLVLLSAQAGYFYFYELAQIPVLRPPLARACAWLGCHLPPRQDFDRIELLRSRIEQTGGQGDRLQIRLELVNRADFVQPFPWLEASLTDRRGRTLARRAFRPSEYLGDADRAARGMPPQVAVPVVLDINNPDQNAVGYELRLLPPPVARRPDLPWLPPALRP